MCEDFREARSHPLPPQEQTAHVATQFATQRAGISRESNRSRTTQRSRCAHQPGHLTMLGDAPGWSQPNLETGALGTERCRHDATLSLARPRRRSTGGSSAGHAADPSLIPTKACMPRALSSTTNPSFDCGYISLEQPWQAMLESRLVRRVPSHSGTSPIRERRRVHTWPHERRPNYSQSLARPLVIPGVMTLGTTPPTSVIGRVDDDVVFCIRQSSSVGR